jgi:hypothetical protein
MKKLITSVFLVFGLYSNSFSQENWCDVDYKTKLGMDTLSGCCLWEEFTVRIYDYYDVSSVRIIGLDELTWTFEYIGIIPKGSDVETYYSMCSAEKRFGH